jgi:uncharacterized protein (DUF1684 family)
VTSPHGWLNLVGLYWLEPGMNTFGSGPQNAVVFPEGTIELQAGYFLVTQQEVSVFVNSGVAITANGQPVPDKFQAHIDSIQSIRFESDSLEWNIIRRDTKLGIRLRDKASNAVKAFAGIARYPVDPAYRVEAVFEPADSSHTIAITNVIGQTTSQRSPGVLLFTLQGLEHRLDVLDGGEDEFFVIFSDETSGRDTYGGGRFVYVGKPDAQGKVFIDFNKAHNPPCVFTPFATCPLPPDQNALKVEVRAGEKNYVKHL